ncbi:MAG: TauD/TfdA family dioxygenase [Rhodospirillales bacterium]
MSEYETITVRPLATNIGAEIEGLDLSRPMDNRQTEEFHRAFAKHHVLFFRDQTMTPDQHKAVGRMFGELAGVPFIKSLEGHPEIVEIVKEAEEVKTYNFGGDWHTDMTFLKEPAVASVLYGREIPETGGDTKFASTEAAYAALSDGMKRLLAGLTAMHSGAKSYGVAGKFAKSKVESMKINPDEAGDAEVEHPVVRVNPMTGQPALYINPNYTVRLKDMTAEESAPLLNYLYSHMTRDEFTCRFKWTADAVAIWDNRVTMHRAINDYDGTRRVAHRVTAVGDRPEAFPS